MTAIDDFEELGKRASYHYADDSGKEWGLARKAQTEALRIFDENPDEQTAMREIAKGFLWAGEFKRARPETSYQRL